MYRSTDLPDSSSITTIREFVEFSPWAPAPQPSPEVLQTPPFACPGSPLKGYAILLTDAEIELFMDDLGDDDELAITTTEIHALFPHVGEMVFSITADSEVLVREVYVPVPATSTGDTTKFWRASGIVLATNDDPDGMDVSEMGELVQLLQSQLGIETRPGWYEIMEDSGPSLTGEELQKISSKSGSSQLSMMFEAF